MKLSDAIWVGIGSCKIPLRKHEKAKLFLTDVDYTAVEDIEAGDYIEVTHLEDEEYYLCGFVRKEYINGPRPLIEYEIPDDEEEINYQGVW